MTFFLFAYWHDPYWKQFAGATVKILDLANNLVALGHDVTLFVPNFKFNKNKFSFNLKQIGFLNLPLLRFVSFNLCLFLTLVKYFIKHRPDIIYVRRMQSVVPLFLSKLFDIPFFFEVNDDPYRQLHHSGSSQAFRIRAGLSIKMDEVNLRGCDKAFIVTDEIRDKIIVKNPRLKRHKLKVLNSGANTTLFRPLSKNECCRKLGLDPAKNYIGYLGAIFKPSGLDVLVDSAPDILLKIPKTEFLIFGDGPQKAQLIEMTKNIGLDRKFKFFGQIDYPDIPVCLGATDICVAPFLETNDTNSATKIFDYLTCGKPVVASNIAHKANIFTESKSVKFVEPGNSKMLAKAVISLLENKELANEMSQNGREFIVRNHSREEIARKISDFAGHLAAEKAN